MPRSYPDPIVSGAPQVRPARYVRIPLAALMTGYTAEAIQQKISRADWRQGREWRYTPNGEVVIDMRGYERWVESQPLGPRPRRKPGGLSDPSPAQTKSHGQT